MNPKPILGVITGRNVNDCEKSKKKKTVQR